ncbi:MAG: IS110 family transposase, partial [Planctomyces sp.]
MAMPARELDFGVDVAKASVQIDGEGLSLELSNTTRDLRTWLKRLPSRACFALEETSTFHLTFANLAHELG